MHQVQHIQGTAKSGNQTATESIQAGESGQQLHHITVQLLQIPSVQNIPQAKACVPAA
jgi:hypothetical protein